MTTVLTLDEIKGLLDVSRLIEEIEAGFVLYSEGRVCVPPVGFLHFDEPPGDVHIKYGYVIGDDTYVLKMASGFYDNPALGLAAGNGLVLVFSQKTGQPQFILLDECWLTDQRTAAAGAVAARHLAPASVTNIGIVGTGVQARLQLQLLRHVVECRSCIIWGRRPDRVKAMIDELMAMPELREWGIEISSAANLEELTSQCELIVTTTSSTSPLIMADQVRPGTHITAMGSDDQGKQEIDAKLLGRADRVVADSVSQCVGYGECIHAVQAGLIEQDAIVELGDVINDPAKGRTDQEQITIADLTGVAIQDIQVAKMVSGLYMERNQR